MRLTDGFISGAKRLVASHPVIVGGTIVAAVAGTALVATTDRSGNDGPSAVVGPGSAPRDDLVIRAVGDSVTAGFGYYADGSPVPASEILGGFKDKLFAAPGEWFFGIPGGVGRCLPPSPPDGRCQSPARVAYPAAFAQQIRVPLRRPSFENLAVSGTTPQDWLSGPFADELSDVVGADPDLTVLTVGANPLLQTFLVGKAICARTVAVRRCVDDEIEKNRVTSRVASVLEQLLATPKGGREGDVAILAYHEAHPVPAYGATVSVLLDRLNAAISAAIDRVRERHPKDKERLILLSPPSFSDHQCQDDEPWVLLTDSCIHPNALGHQMLAAMLVEAMEDRLPEPKGQADTPTGSDRGEELLIEVAGSGEIKRIGPFEPRQYLASEGTRAGVEPTIANAIAAFGPPASREAGEGLGCMVEWPELSLVASADDFGGGPVCGDQAGIQELSVVGAGADRWQTDRGLRVGDSQQELLKQYPSAFVDPRREHTYILVEQASPIGETGRIERLTATVFDTRVTAIQTYLYGAGE